MRVLALAVLLALVAACAPAPHDALRLAIPTAPLTLDPRYATDAMSARLSRLLHRPLVDFDGQARPVPALARWRQIDARHYEFTLVEDARFDDGRAIRAADVVATYEAVRDPVRASPLKDSLRNLAAVRALDERRVAFELARPDPLFPGTLTLGVMAAEDAALPRDAWRRASGAFAREARLANGGVRLRRLRDGARIEVLVVKDASVRALKLVAGEIDLAQGNLPPEMLDWLGTQAGVTVLARPGTTYSYLGLALAHPALADRRVREALSLAIDREAITRHLFRGLARPAGGLLPASHWAAADLAPPPHDPARARALLAEAGYGARPLRLRYKTSADAFRLRVATALQAQLAQVGVELAIDSLDWATFYADVSHGRFELYGLSFVGVSLPDIFRQVFHGSARPPAGLNRGGYAAPDTDRLIEAAEAETDDARRVALYRAVQRRVEYDLPLLPLWFEDQTAVLRRELHDYELDAQGSFDGLARVRRVTADGGR